MNQKELGEIRRRIRPEKNNISHIYGCYVNEKREIISDFDAQLHTMPQEDAEKYMALLHKTLSGALGRNLLDISFSSQQVMEGEEHQLLSELRRTELGDAELRQALYSRIIEAVSFEDSGCLILLAFDTYDVPYKGKDDSDQPDASAEVFRYMLCAVCPVKPGKLELAWFSQEQGFHSFLAGHTASAPEMGFLFPTFDGRQANIYNALLYTRSASDVHQELIDAVFRTEPLMSAEAQKETFHVALRGTLEKDCSFDVVQSVNEQLHDRIAEHKESKDPEPLELSIREAGDILRNSGVSEEKTDAFCEKCEADFGENAVLRPSNLIGTRRYEIATPGVTVQVDPEYSYLVETRRLNGHKYILISADDGLTVNGMDVEIPEG